MEVEEAFAEFYSRILPSNHILAKVRQHCDSLKRLLSNDHELAPEKFYYSGSYAKNTTISPLKDVDVASYYRIERCRKENGDFYSPGFILGKFFTRLRQTYGSRITVRRQKRSIGIRFVDFDVEIVPVFWDGNEKYIGLIADREERSWIKTSIPLHIEFLRKRDLSYRPYGKTVRLVKTWKVWNSVPMKGFALELLTVKALDRYGTSANLGVNFSNVLRYTVEGGFRAPIWFDDYMRHDELRVTKSPIVIVDPVNPTNNVTGEVDEYDKGRILSKFTHAYQQTRWALKSEAEGDTVRARLRWRAVFGYNFPGR